MSVAAQMGTVFQPINTDQAPPTYFPTKVTAVFQGIEAYGVGRYREVNPTVPPSSRFHSYSR